MNRELLSKIVSYPLSGQDIIDAVGFPINIYKYSMLDRYDDIFTLFAEYDSFCILYETKRNFGHWTCVLLHRKKNGSPKSIEFFDSYGLEIDEQLDFLSDYFKEKNNMERTHLGWLLYESNLPLEYNNHQLQKFAVSINTCGCWCSLRIICRHLNIDLFSNAIQGLVLNNNSELTLDEKAAILIFPLLSNVINNK